MASASASASAAPPSNEEDAIKLINANPEHYLIAFNYLKKIAAAGIMRSQDYKKDPSIETLQCEFMPVAFMTWYYDNNPESECPIGKKRKELNFTGFKNKKLVTAMELVKRNNELRHATTLGGRKKRSRTNRRSRIRRQKRRTSRRY